MTITIDTALHRAIDHTILMSPRRLAPVEVCERIADAVRAELSVETRDGYVIEPEVSAELVDHAWTVTVDGEQLAEPFEDVRFADFDV